MVKSSNGFIILGADLQSGLVKKKSYKDLVEYWCYRAQETELYLPNGQKAKSQDKSNIFLYSIVVCEKNHITAKRLKGYFVNGIRFTEGDLKNYLDKTHRSAY